MHRPLFRPSRGFTLIELLVTLAVASILASLAAPSFRSFIRSVQLTNATNDFFAGMLLARSEAVKRRNRVAMCKSTDGSACAPSGGWDQGWIVFEDLDDDGTRGRSEAVLFSAEAMRPELRLSGNMNVSRYISYSPTGAARLAGGGGFQAGTIVLCNESAGPTEARQIILSASGRPRIQKATVTRCPG